MPCNICGEKNAPYGYGFAGFRHERKSEAILRVCQPCIPVAEVRWKAANANPIAQDAPGRIPTGSRPGVTGQSGKSGPDSGGGEDGNNCNSQQGELGI
jgi:hypothetical protein